MKKLSNHVSTRPWRALLNAACLAALLTGCGGGGDTSSTSTSTFASGPITGLGSIIVNGVRFDDTSARVSSDDDDNGESRGRSDLKLGMMVDVQGGATTSDDSGRRCKAHEIRFGSELVGPVSTKGTNSFTLLGQTINVSTATVFDDRLVGGFDAISVGDVLEVHGIFDAASNSYSATRIEPKTGATSFKIRGAIESLDTPAGTFTIGGELISYASLSPKPSGLANGQIVRVKVKTTQVEGAWVATRIKSGVRKIEDHDEAEIEGAITAFTSDAAFEVNGIPVDASGVANPPAGLGIGITVEVHGRSQAGMIIASRIEIEDRNREGAGEFEFHRRIAQFDAVNSSFVLGAVTIQFDARTVFAKGATADTLKDGDCVEVSAVTASASTTLRAVRIKFDNSCTS